MDTSGESSAASRPTRPAGRRNWRFKLLFLLLPFAILGLLEITFRQFDWFPDPLAGIGALPERVRSGRSFFPDWHTQIQMPKPKNRFRIITLGGSSTFGFGASRNFSQIVADKLTKSHPQREWEVINGGVVAVGSKRIRKVLEYGASFDPDLIVIYFGHNEFLERAFYDPNGLVAHLRAGKRWARQFRIVNGLRG